MQQAPEAYLSSRYFHYKRKVHKHGKYDKWTLSELEMCHDAYKKVQSTKNTHRLMKCACTVKPWNTYHEWIVDIDYKPFVENGNLYATNERHVFRIDKDKLTYMEGYVAPYHRAEVAREEEKSMKRNRENEEYRHSIIDNRDY